MQQCWEATQHSENRRLPHELVTRRGFRTQRTPYTSWYGNTFAPFWGADIQLELHVDSTRPSDIELNRLESILFHPHSIRDSIVNSIREFYGQLIEDGADFGISCDDLTTDFVSSSISLPSVDPNPISMERCGDVSFLMSFSCTLDVEHGIDAWIVDWAVARVGCLQ